MLSRIEELEKSNRTRGVARVYARLCKRDPQAPRWQHKLGDALRRLRRDDGATEAYSKAITLYMSSGKPRHALALCQVVLDMDPENMAVRSLQLRLKTMTRRQQSEREKRFTDRLEVPASGKTPQTSQGWPTVADFVDESSHTVDVARAQARAIQEAAGGRPPPTWDPPESTPMLDIDEEMFGPAAMPRVEHDPMHAVYGHQPVTPQGEVELDPTEVEFETPPVAEDLGAVPPPPPPEAFQTKPSHRPRKVMPVVEEDLEIIHGILEHRSADVELQYTRSKQSLVA